MAPEKRKANRKPDERVKDEEITNKLYMPFDNAMRKISAVRKEQVDEHFKASKKK